MVDACALLRGAAEPFEPPPGDWRVDTYYAGAHALVNAVPIRRRDAMRPRSSAQNHLKASSRQESQRIEQDAGAGPSMRFRAPGKHRGGRRRARRPSKTHQRQGGGPGPPDRERLLSAAPRRDDSQPGPE
jgi:hypothetical protein